MEFQNDNRSELEASEGMGRSLTISPKDRDLRLQLVVHFMRSGLYDAALDELHLLIRDDPNNLEAQRLIGLIEHIVERNGKSK